MHIYIYIYIYTFRYIYIESVCVCREFDSVAVRGSGGRCTPWLRAVQQHSRISCILGGIYTYSVHASVPSRACIGIITHPHKRTHTHTHTHTHIWERIDVLHVLPRTARGTCAHTHTHAHAHTRTHTHTHTRAHTHTYTHTHTHIT